MTQEDKKLLLKDLCAMLPYYPKCEMIDELRVVNSEKDSSYISTLFPKHIELFSYHNNFTIKPYLRSMSSMTDEEKEEMHNLLSPDGTAIYGYDGISMPMNHYGEFVSYEFMNNIIHYLLKNHFDFMGLIPKGLAIEVTEENNPYKE